MVVDKIAKYLSSRWNNYKFRFVPWIAINLHHKLKLDIQRISRGYPQGSEDILGITNFLAGATTTAPLILLKDNARIVPSKKADPLVSPDRIVSQLNNVVPFLIRPKKYEDSMETYCIKSRSIMFHKLGFSIERGPSLIPGGGTGVFVTKGKVRRGKLVALYPGTIYRSFEPILLASINNPFVFRCLDGTHIDGKDCGLSKIVFKSCAGRDRMGPREVADISWLTKNPVNPLNVGQYVNNHNKEYPSNVAYQEVELHPSLAHEMRPMLPYINYSGGRGLPTRIVALVATRDINQGEEIFSSYVTLVGTEK